ncbi:Aste57867_25315 [Aphanomyces stellatus]|uniref:Aste57867_25315 protein n=1 Tax=Aphanomyces stellatus TaxID=120398 RepID=A0A485LU57_9STRA|nr:hypothetical protein As57867_025237 [Aphanomyces stellatus]VFU01940.1 Aste57867_25315 [Aphanomyces stellatus]
MQQAVPLLTANVIARLYFDVGYWTLKDDSSTKSVADVIASVGSKSRKGAVKGIVLNTSNFRKTPEMIDKCKAFLTAAKQDAYRCVIDTSRNYRTPNTTSEWCNNKYAAIGVPPTSNTGMPDVLDYFLWVKVPGESDGECVQSKDALIGPMERRYFVDKNLGDVVPMVTRPVNKATTTKVAVATTAAPAMHAPTVAPTSTLLLETTTNTPTTVVPLATMKLPSEATKNLSAEGQPQVEIKAGTSSAPGTDWSWGVGATLAIGGVAVVVAALFKRWRDDQAAKMSADKLDVLIES